MQRNLNHDGTRITQELKFREYREILNKNQSWEEVDKKIYQAIRESYDLEAMENRRGNVTINSRTERELHKYKIRIAGAQ